MDKDLFSFFKGARDLYQNFTYFFQPRVKPCENHNEYLSSCGYLPHKAPFLSITSNFGAYSLDMLNDYRDAFLFNAPGNKDTGSVIELCFNIKSHQHCWIRINNIPEAGSKSPRYVCVPTLFAVNPQDNLDFIDNNEKHLIMPTTDTKVVGFKA